ncbi:hypothetical protein [Flavobacterium sp. UGB4466]|uniref:hypothetical protein n=1 Tax=Flavobacterium sp. UGB4466 TaxID=2730889 RepID=UPI00192B067F|nr:hypothetical protein [Flavobacterium sp. UGB4466]
MNKSIPYCITPTPDGAWLHTCNENLLLASLPKDTDNKTETILLEAFKNSLALFVDIRAALKKTCHTTPFVGGLYLVDGTEMQNAMITINGMGETSAYSSTKSYSGTPSAVNLQFFEDVLGISNDKLKYLESNLLRYMKIIQEDAKRATAETIGILTCVVGYVELTGTTVTTFTYVTVTTTTKDQFDKIDCECNDLDKFNYEFNIIKFNYSPVNYAANRVTANENN